MATRSPCSITTAMRSPTRAARRPLPPRHPIPLASLSHHRRAAAAAADFDLARRQRDADLRSHQPRPLRRRGPAHPGARSSTSRRSLFLWDSACYERIALRNFDDRRRRVRIDLTFAADFADLFEVRGAERARRGALDPPEVERRRGAARLSRPGPAPARDRAALRPGAAGADGAARDLHFRPRAPRRADGDAHDRLRQHGDRTRFVARFAVPARGAAGAPLLCFAGHRHRHLERDLQRGGPPLGLRPLHADHRHPRGPYPYAGIPWFSTVFGRDALITALQMLWLDPRSPAACSRYLAANQATDDRSRRRRRARQDPARGAPRRDGGARRSAVRPLLRQRRFHAAVRHAGRRLSRAHRRSGPSCASSGRNIEAALGWIENYGDRDGDGFVEYGRQTEDGPDQPGLEGQPRLDLPRRRRAGEGADRARRGAGLRLCRLARRRARSPPRSASRSAAAGSTQARRSAAAALRRRLLRRGARHLRAGARRRQAALPGAHPPTPAMRCSPASPRRSGPRRSRTR